MNQYLFENQAIKTGEKMCGIDATLKRGDQYFNGLWMKCDHMSKLITKLMQATSHLNQKNKFCYK